MLVVSSLCGVISVRSEELVESSPCGVKIVRRRSLGEGNSVRDEWLLAKRFPDGDRFIV